MAKHHLRWFALALALALCSREAQAFKPIGHEAIEALAYRRFSEMPQQPMCELTTGADSDADAVTGTEVLRLLIAVGALAKPPCFDAADDDSWEARACAITTGDQRATWPPLGAGKPDDLFARQVGGNGQCFHFMAEASDAYGHGIDPSTGVSAGFSHDAYERCTGLVNSLWLELLGNPDGSRNAQRGLYALMHSIEDSFSAAHTERDSSGKILYLRPWDLLSLSYLWSARGPGPTYLGTERQHQISDERDNGWRSGEISLACPANNDPYTLAQREECYSPRGRQAAAALVDLLKVTYCAFRASPIPKMWRADNGPRATLTAAVSAQWNHFVARHLASANTLPRPLPDLNKPDADRIHQPEKIPQLLVGARARLAPGSAHESPNFGDALIALETFPPLRDTYPFVPLFGGEAGLRWSHGKRLFGGSLTLLSAMLPLSEHLAVALQPATVEAFWNTEQSEPAQVEFLSSLRVMVFISGEVWLDFSSPRYAWRENAFRIDPSFTLGYAWDLSNIAPLGDSGYRNAGADWSMRPIHPKATNYADATAEQGTTVAMSLGFQADPDPGGYGVRIVFPEILYAPHSLHGYLNAGGALLGSTQRDHVGYLTTLGVSSRLYFAPLPGVFGIGLSPLQIDGGASNDDGGSYWGVSSWANIFLRLASLQLSADMPLIRWRGDRDQSFGRPAFVMFGWVQTL